MPNRAKVSVAAALLLLLAGGLLAARAAHWSGKLPDAPEGAEPNARLAAELRQARSSWRFALRPQASAWSLATLYHANGYYEAARQCYAALDSGRFGQRRSYYQADAALALGDLEAAGDHLEAVAEAEPDYLPALLRLGEVRYKRGQTERAVEAFFELLRQDDSHPQALLGLARALQSQGEDDKALAALRRLAEARPDYAPGMAVFASLLSKLGKEAEAQEARDRARRGADTPLEDPWMDELMLSCFDLQRLSFYFEDYVKSGQRELADAYLQRMLRLDPGNWNTHFLQGFYANKQGQSELALRSYREALELGGDAASLYAEIAKLLLDLGRRGEAEEAVEQGLAAAPQSASLWALKAELETLKGRRAAARRSWEAALEIAPSDLSANMALARLLWESGERSQALERLEAARQAHRRDLPSRMLIAQLHLEAGRPGPALDALEEAYRLAPENGEVRSLLALAALRRGNELAREGAFDQADRHYDRAIDVQPESPQAYANKARVLLAAGDPATAEAELERLRRQRASNPAVYLALGDVQLQGGEPAAARESWANGLALTSDAAAHEALRRALTQRLEAVPQP